MNIKNVYKIQSFLEACLTKEHMTVTIKEDDFEPNKYCILYYERPTTYSITEGKLFLKFKGYFRLLTYMIDYPWKYNFLSFSDDIKKIIENTGKTINLFTDFFPYVEDIFNSKFITNFIKTHDLSFNKSELLKSLYIPKFSKHIWEEKDFKEFVKYKVLEYVKMRISLKEDNKQLK